MADQRVDFAYNGLGQFTTIDRYQNTGGSNIVAQTTFAYDDDNRLTDLDHKQSSTTLAGYDYGYDNMGRITSINSTVEGQSNFTYDKTSQLTGADHASPRADESYSYDDNGNRTMSGYTVTANNLTTSDGTYDYEYDDEGNRTKRTEISSGDYEVYEWDHRNRLISVTFYDSTDAVLKTVDHTYDVFNRWLRRTSDPDGPGSESAIDTFFAYDGIEPILQFDGPADSDLTNRYLFGPAVDQILAEEDVTSLSSAGNILWPLSDHLGTPRDLADQNESTYTTTVTNHRTYDSFGRLTAETNASVDLLFGFTGKALDEDTGLGNHWFRWLGHDLDQWLSEDVSGFIAGDQNLRRYVTNSSTHFIDGTGLAQQFPFAVLGPQPLTTQWAIFQATNMTIMAFIAKVGPPTPCVLTVFDRAYDFAYGFSDVATLGTGPLARYLLDYDPQIHYDDPSYLIGAATPVVIVTAGAATLPVGAGAGGMAPIFGLGGTPGASMSTTLIGTTPTLGVGLAGGSVAAGAGQSAPALVVWDLAALRVQYAAVAAVYATTKDPSLWMKLELLKNMIKEAGGAPPGP